MTIQDGGNPEGTMESYLQRQRAAGKLNSLYCNFCVFLVTEIHDMLKQKTAVDVIVREAIKVCILFKIEDEHICKLVVPQFQVS